MYHLHVGPAPGLPASSIAPNRPAPESHSPQIDSHPPRRRLPPSLPPPQVPSPLPPSLPPRPRALQPTPSTAAGPRLTLTGIRTSQKPSTAWRSSWTEPPRGRLHLADAVDLALTPSPSPSQRPAAGMALLDQIPSIKVPSWRTQLGGLICRADRQHRRSPVLSALYSTLNGKWKENKI